MRVLVLGDTPSSKTKNNPTLKRLGQWLDELNLDIVSFSNVSDIELESYCYEYDKVIALGNIASNKLQLLSVGHFKLPHPSPRNRQLNSKVYESDRLMKCNWYLGVA